jgi:DNA-binding response OmpR family regulator
MEVMRILVVEDERRIAQTIKRGLEQERYRVDLAFTGREGLEWALAEEYDLILLDVMLPELDGLSVCRSLREQQRVVPILMLTAKSQIEDTVTGLDAGADDYLSKPFSFEELLARIRALARRPKALQTERLTAADLSLERQTFKVVRDQAEIFLSNKEFKLLEYLLVNQDRILTKEQIIDHVWDLDADILPNTVEVYIKNLRQKIDRPFPDKPPLIKTVRGFGYRIGGK